jgi:adenylate cyclase
MMGKEIERKFRIDPDELIPGEKKKHIRQGYLSADPERTVRIRISGDSAFLTIKGKSNGIARDEFEYSIPVDDAEILLSMSKDFLIEKTRFYQTVGGKLWEIDRFEGENEGLWLAEIELDSEDEEFVLPEWITQEVSGDPRFYNSYLSENPYKNW